MLVEIVTDSITEVNCDALIVNIFEDAETPSGATGAVDNATGGQLTGLIRAHRGAGKFGRTTVLHICSGVGAGQIILLGLGKKADFTVDRLREVAGTAIRAARKADARIVATIVHGAGQAGFDPRNAAQALVEGTILGNYRFKCYKTGESGEEDIYPETLLIVENDQMKAAAFAPGVSAGLTIAASVNLARDLVNHPANHMTPTNLAAQAQLIADRHGLPLDILDIDDIAAIPMSAFLAVAQGSHEPPKVVVMRYDGAPDNKDRYAFIGKGITFDSGGISLKPSEGMHEMKDDMAGAAAVIAAMQAIAGLKLRVNLIAIMPCTENLPSGYAFRPGDVIRSLGGKTIEIISTDAEGRLILVDAITYAIRQGATHLIDLATLTGACVVALGNVTSGVMTNNRELCRQVLDAAAAAGEKMWELPMFDEYKDQINSDTADLKNSGGRPAGAITAAQFIAAFTETKPWVHIDIAGTVSCDKDGGYNVKGATGVGVRTLVALAERLGAR